jgi:predicted unusual protein kinase regulating ubiquinone biosynthesis (AarF/ABC1/UbiB family)
LNTGEKVAIKFKRVGIDQTIHADFSLLLSAISFIKSIMVNRQITEVEISLREYYQLLQEEINFRNEVENMKAFGKKCATVKHIKVPKPVEAMCSNDVIVMEYVPSIKINNTAALDERSFSKTLISEKLLESFFTQIVDYGFVHIDPHPGNVGITEAGKIVFYDYGMFVRLDTTMRSNLKSLFLALYDRDVEEVCDILINLGIVLVEPSKVPSFRKFIASFLSYLDTLDISNFKLSYLDRIDQSEMQFLFSSKMILLLRGITILEGVCKTLYPTFNYREVLDPFISDFIVDVDYLERRGKKDLSKFTQAPDKITKSEISLNLVETDVTQLRRQLTQTENKSRFAMFAILTSVWIQCESFESKCTAILAFLYILVNK